MAVTSRNSTEMTNKPHEAQPPETQSYEAQPYEAEPYEIVGPEQDAVSTRNLLVQITQILAELMKQTGSNLVDIDRVLTPLPAAMHWRLMRVVADLWITEEQAADIWHTSEPGVDELIATGKLETRVKNGRRVLRFVDLAVHKQPTSENSTEVLHELTRMCEEYGWYEDELQNPPKFPIQTR